MIVPEDVTHTVRMPVAAIQSRHCYTVAPECEVKERIFAPV
jgi:hypothetical protein